MHRVGLKKTPSVEGGTLQHPLAVKRIKAHIPQVSASINEGATDEGATLENIAITDDDAPASVSFPCKDGHYRISLNAISRVHE